MKDGRLENTFNIIKKGVSQPEVAKTNIITFLKVNKLPIFKTEW